MEYADIGPIIPRILHREWQPFERRMAEEVRTAPNGLGRCGDRPLRRGLSEPVQFLRSPASRIPLRKGEGGDPAHPCLLFIGDALISRRYPPPASPSAPRDSPRAAALVGCKADLGLPDMTIGDAAAG
jgi:hypothetical protein